MADNRNNYPSQKITGRASIRNVEHRFSILQKQTNATEFERDEYTDEDGAPLNKNSQTSIQWDNAKSILNRLQSPDLPYSQTINPYRGCEHGCIYCYARASHAYLDLSPGLDFEQKLFAKSNTEQLLIQALSQPKYQPKTIAIGMNTDCYQPIEKSLEITRHLLKILYRCQHPVVLITKSALIERDLDILVPMAEKNLMDISISMTTLDHSLKQILEPRASSPQRRLKIIENLSKKGIKVTAMLSPIIPSISDHEIENILTQVANAGAYRATYSLVRLPHEVKDVFSDWLQHHFPDRHNKVMNQIYQQQNQNYNASEFYQRFTGTGEEANLIKQRFTITAKKNNLIQPRIHLDHNQFCPPSQNGTTVQGTLNL